MKIHLSQVSVTQQALIIAQKEADFHYKDTMLINERGNKDSVETKDFKNIIEHLTFITNNTLFTRILKYACRIITRNDPIRSKNPNEVLFLKAKPQPVSKLLVTIVQRKKM